MKAFAESVRALLASLRSRRGAAAGPSAAGGDATVLREGETRLAVVHGGRIVAQTADITLSHAELVQRTVGALPEGAWVGTLRKSAGVVVAMNSRTFYGNQLPAPAPVLDAVRAAFR